MTERTTHHATFTIERDFPVPAPLAFKAWADPAARACWFVGPKGKWQEISRAADFRIGGREQVSGTHEGGVVSAFDCRYLDIVPDQRIVYSYVMHLNDKLISVSLATIEFESTGKGTHLIVTEQGVMLDGFSDPGAAGRKHGTEGLMDRLEAFLRAEAR